MLKKHLKSIGKALISISEEGNKGMNLSKIVDNKIEELKQMPSKVINDKLEEFRPIPHSENATWKLSLTFKKSSSNMYQTALNMSQSLPTYKNHIDENGDEIHIVEFNKTREQFLTFIQIYDIVGSWKSCIVAINNELVDKKTVGKIKYCYGDKCRSVKSNFCYGASLMTDNPFGCHRLQISHSNNPWWGYYRRTRSGKYKLDKASIANRIKRTADTFHYCPDFNLDRILKNANKLPAVVSEKELQRIITRNLNLPYY